MAKLTDLVRTLADVLGVPEATVAGHARYLRAARLISTAGRGPGGADMTYGDAATLLGSIVSGEQAKDAAIAVQNLRQIYYCEALKNTIVNGRSIEVGVHDVDEHGQAIGNDFVNSIASLIKDVGGGKYGSIEVAAGGEKYLKCKDGITEISIAVWRPKYHAYLIVQTGKSPTPIKYYRVPGQVGVDYYAEEGGDFVSIYRVHQKTIIALAQLGLR